MASKLVLEFVGTGSNVKCSYNYADPDTTPATVKALMTGMIANGSIFAVQPLEAKSAKLVTTTEEDYDLSA